MLFEELASTGRSSLLFPFLLYFSSFLSLSSLLFFAFFLLFAPSDECSGAWDGFGAASASPWKLITTRAIRRGSMAPATIRPESAPAGPD